MAVSFGSACRMASRKALLITAAAMAVVVGGALLPATVSAARIYRIGDDHGWDLGVDYNAWASGRTFNVGDIFEFVYTAGAHNVVMVDEASYEACTVPSDAPTLSSGHEYVTFPTAGQRFYICGVKDHCQSGMKLTFNVQ